MRPLVYITPPTIVLLAVLRSNSEVILSGQSRQSKNSTEAELIAVSDALPHIIWTRDFLLEKGYAVPPTTLFQDNL